MRDTLSDQAIQDVLEQFERLMTEILNGELQRVAFLPWEMALLVDISTSDATLAELREYRVAVRHELGNGQALPMKLSDYLARRRQNTAVEQ